MVGLEIEVGDINRRGFHFTFFAFCFFSFTFPALCVVVGGLQLEVFDRNRRGRPWQNYDAAGSQRSNQTYRLDLTLITNKIHVKEILILQS